MTDSQMDLLVSAATPVDDAYVTTMPLHGADEALRDAILRPPPTRRRWVLRTAVAGVACAGALGLAAAIGIDRDGAGTAWAAPLVRAAETSPRLLVVADGWRVVRADEFLPGLGEVEFSDGERSFQLNWEPGPARGPKGDPVVGHADVLGSRARIESAPGSTSFRAFWRLGASNVSLMGEAAGLDGFRAVLAALRPVDVDAWLRAMPASVATPGGRGRVVDAMLAGIPIPPGLDLARLREDDGRVRDRYQLGAFVAGAVACEWIGRWVSARAAGDAAGAQAAVEAMATARSWPILRQMDAEGDYPDVVWELAAAMPSNGPVPAGKPMGVAEAYGSALGCDLG
jgi:hypothetical protein